MSISPNVIRVPLHCLHSRLSTPFLLLIQFDLEPNLG
jgi:hypothetical protein